MLLKETVPPTLHHQVLIPDGNGDGGRYLPPRPTQSLEGFLVAAGQYARRRRQPKVLAALLHAEVAWDFLLPPGDMPGDGEGR